MYDIQEIRKDFPILGREVYGRPLVYLDNGATTQKPRCVVEAMTDEYYNVNANVHRGVHFLSQQATELHEAARETVRRFLNARSASEIVFTRGTTESINLVASCFGEAFMREGDEVILSEMEHHSNIVSWQLLQARKGIKLRVVPINDRGELMLDEYERLFNDRTRIVSVTHVSNVLGTVNPVRRMIGIAHAHGVPVLVDGAQSTPHFAVDMQSLDADFFAFSGHKIYGPTGVGVLYGKETWLDRLPPYMGGGEMIRHVTFGHTTFNGLPFKFEAGTPDYVATTGQDDSNLVSCEIAQRVFRVPRCIARVNNPKNERIFREVGIECVSSTTLIANLIEEEALLGSVSVVSSLTHGNVALAEVMVPRMRHFSNEDGVLINEVLLPDNAIIAAVASGGDVEVANDETVLHPGDKAIVVADEDVLDDVRLAFRGL